MRRLAGYRHQEIAARSGAVSGQIQFNDGGAYENYMGLWSQLAAESFLAWLAPRPGLRWLDVGCGSGAFTATIIEWCAPAAVDGIDPSQAQIEFARTRPALSVAQFRQGDAMELPYAAESFDAAVMALVIFFVPEPARGVGEMARVVRPGGIVAAYAWDMAGGGFPYAALQAEMRAMGVAVPVPPSPDASRLEAMQSLWAGAGLEAVETREISVQRTFADFNEYWTAILGGPSVGPQLAAMSSTQLTALKGRLQPHLPTDASGRITYGARANAVKGRKPQ
ncbi:MAG: methyltransferase domain-containing protein [Gammaproteobacteria bacterium]|nr:methyltransferase domain-containing protein [Gammaproteobacteria bacterium]